MNSSDHNRFRRNNSNESSHSRYGLKYRNKRHEKHRKQRNKKYFNDNHDRLRNWDHRRYSKWNHPQNFENSFYYSPPIPQSPQFQQAFAKSIIDRIIQSPPYNHNKNPNNNEPYLRTEPTSERSNGSISETAVTSNNSDSIINAPQSSISANRLHQNTIEVDKPNKFTNRKKIKTNCHAQSNNGTQLNEKIKDKGGHLKSFDSTKKTQSSFESPADESRTRIYLEPENKVISSTSEFEANICNTNERTTALVDECNTFGIDRSEFDCVPANVRDEYYTPTISVVPLSLLIDPKLQTSDEVHASDKDTGTTPEHAETTNNNIQVSSIEADAENFKKPEVISKKLINKVATMDKTNIRNVINNSILKFDVALKMHAKKRLREEIRKQLRNINFETRQAVEENGLQPDGYIDPENIPIEVLREFETVFNMNFDSNSDVAVNQTSDVLQVQSTENPGEEHFPDSCHQLPVTSQSEGEMFNNRELNLRTKLLNFEYVKQQAILRRCRQQSIEDDDVRIVETPEKTTPDAYDESSIDSSTTNTSATSNTSSQQKLPEKFLESFKKDVLPNLPENMRSEYENSSGKNEAISKIYNMCMEKLHTLQDHNQRTRINFSTANNEDALSFLVQNIRDLFVEKGNKNACQGEIKSPNTKNRSNKRVTFSEIVTEKCYEKDNHGTNIECSSQSRTRSHQQKEGENLMEKQNERSLDEIKPSSIKSNAVAGQKDQHKNNYARHYNNNSNPFKSNASKASRNRSKSRNLEKQKNENEPSSTPLLPKPHQNENRKRKFDGSGCEPSSQDSAHMPAKVNIISTNSSSALGCKERLWRSPGEKKCIVPTPSHYLSKTEISNAPTNLQIDSVTPDSTAKPLQEATDRSSSNENHDEAGSQITSSSTEKNTPSKLDANGLQDLKQLDAKLMELNEKRMEIEKKIIELQKEKMEIDLSVMQLQNERFVLISSVVSDPSGYLTQNPNLQNLLTNSHMYNSHNNSAEKAGRNSKKPKKAKKKKGKQCAVDEKKKSAFAEKLKNRKKRCNRDILIEDAASTLFPDSSNKCYEEIRNSSPSQLNEKVNNLFSMPTRRSQRPIQVVTPEKSSKGHIHSPHKKSPPPVSASNMANVELSVHRSSEDNLLPVSCMGQTVNIIENCGSDSESEDFSQRNCSLSSRNLTNGLLKGFRLPIVNIIGVEGYILCASEDGNIYKFDSNTRQLISTFSKHTESITGMCVDGHGCVYSTSLDGYMKKTSIDNFGLELLSVNFHEPLQAISLSWNIAFVGSRWGNIFTYDIKKSKLNEMLFCSVGSAITALKATKEGPRRIIIISSKGEKIHFRDAFSGLLLRTITVLEKQNISSIVLDGGLLYCGASSNKVFVYDFTTGNEINSFTCGNGAVSLRIFKNKFIFVGCYDGFIYVLDKQSGKQIGRFPGAGKMILALEISGEKVLTSSKDNAVQIMDIPKYILTLTR